MAAAAGVIGGCAVMSSMLKVPGKSGERGMMRRTAGKRFFIINFGLPT